MNLLATYLRTFAILTVTTTATCVLIAGPSNAWSYAVIA